MRRELLVLILTSSCVLTFAQTPQQATPYWAYAVNPPAAASAKAPENSVRHVPNSDAAYTDIQIHVLFGVPDWHPS